MPLSSIVHTQENHETRQLSSYRSWRLGIWRDESLTTKKIHDKSAKDTQATECNP